MSANTFPAVAWLSAEQRLTQPFPRAQPWQINCTRTKSTAQLDISSRDLHYTCYLQVSDTAEPTGPTRKHLVSVWRGRRSLHFYKGIKNTFQMHGMGDAGVKSSQFSVGLPHRFQH